MNVLKFDAEKIDNVIYAFKNLYEREPYLFCSSDTLKIIPNNKVEDVSHNDTPKYMYFIETRKNNKGIDAICVNAYRIFINNDMKFGEMEVR